MRSLPQNWIRVFNEAPDFFFPDLKALLNSRITREEMNFILKILKEEGKKSCTILDLFCGIGRISIPLAKEGFNVVGIDISEKFINYAKNYAKKENVDYKLDLICGDARQLDSLLRNSRWQEFDAVLWLYNSMGYTGKKGDLLILNQLNKYVNEESVMILDIMNRDWFMHISTSWGSPINHIIDAGNFLYIYELEFLLEKSIVKMHIDLYKKDNRDLIFQDEKTIYIRLYSIQELSEMLSLTGWEITELYGDVNRSSFSPISSARVIIIAHRKL